MEWFSWLLHPYLQFKEVRYALITGCGLLLFKYFMCIKKNCVYSPLSYNIKKSIEGFKVINTQLMFLQQVHMGLYKILNGLASRMLFLCIINKLVVPRVWLISNSTMKHICQVIISHGSQEDTQAIFFGWLL